MQPHSHTSWLNRAYRRLLIVMCFVIVFGSLPLVQAVEPQPASSAAPAAPAARAPYSGFLSAPASGNALDIALAYIAQHRSDYALTASDTVDMIVTDQYVSQNNGVTHLYFRQQAQGIEVYNADININVMPDGRILNMGSRFIPSLKKAINTAQPRLTAVEAVQHAAKNLHLAVTAPLVSLHSVGGAAQAVELSNGGISLDSIPARLIYQPLESGEVRLAWQIVLRLANNTEWLNQQIDAETGATLTSVNWIVNEDEGQDNHAAAAASTAAQAPVASTALNPDSYRVYAQPVESPSHGSRTLESNPADIMASPFGWHDTNGVAGAEYTTTRGNNVTAYTDVDDNNLPDPNSAPDGGAGLNFDFALDLAQAPPAYVPASVTNLFYWNNKFHDVLYHYGFDEAGGNFQQNNYGHGGSGSDYVQAEASDGNRLNNANFGTPPDGQPPRMQMFLWDKTTPMRDGSLDSAIVVHEYGHGVSNRLTGGPSNVSCLGNDEQAGEGWSDFYAISMTARPSDTGTTKRPMGTYVYGQSPTTGAGIRAYPYSTDLAVDPRTYNSIKATTGPHPVGSVWTTMVWEVYWNLVDAYGFDPNLVSGTSGNNKAIQLVTDGLKLQPCSPSFVDGRDAILAADMADYNGANQCLIWEGFAKRGLGYSAKAGSSNSRTDGTQAFDLSPVCTINLTPEVINACVTNPVVYQIIAQDIGGPITLGVTGQPAGSTATINPNPMITTPATGTLTLGSLGAATPGAYTLVLAATGGTQPYSDSSKLNLFSLPPTAVTLTAPANGASAQLSQQTFSWSASTQGLSYTLDLATDAGFTNIVQSKTTNATSYKLPNLLAGSTTYYWRVRTTNGCGAGPVSATFSFSVRPTPEILLVDDDQIGAAQTAYTTALDSLSLTYDVWDTVGGSVEPTAAQLAGFKTILWANSEDGFITEAGEEALSARLNSGACLIVSGQEYFYNRGEVVTPFMADYLGLGSAESDISYTTVTGTGPVFGTLGATTLTFPSGFSNWSDKITPDSSATTIFTYGAGLSAGIAKNADTYGTMFLGFPIEAITSASVRADMIGRSIDWCSAFGPKPTFLPLIQR